MAQEVTLDNKIIELNEKLEGFLRKTGVNTVKYNSKVDKILGYTEDEIRKLDPHECGINAYMLMQYATYLQKEYNQALSRVNWADSATKWVIAKQINNYQSNTADERKMLAVRGDEFASKLYQFRVSEQQNVDLLFMMGDRIKCMANVLESIQRRQRNA